jgi:hypothetical protein
MLKCGTSSPRRAWNDRDALVVQEDDSIVCVRAGILGALLELGDALGLIKPDLKMSTWGSSPDLLRKRFTPT